LGCFDLWPHYLLPGDGASWGRDHCTKASWRGCAPVVSQSRANRIGRAESPALVALGRPRFSKTTSRQRRRTLAEAMDRPRLLWSRPKLPRSSTDVRLGTAGRVVEVDNAHGLSSFGTTFLLQAVHVMSVAYALVSRTSQFCSRFAQNFIPHGGSVSPSSLRMA
jgi:hypothetical protein